MRRDVLQRLIIQNLGSLQADLLIKFLKTDKLLLTADNEDISFSDFYDYLLGYLKKNHCTHDLLEHYKSKIGIASDYALFLAFLQNKKVEEEEKKPSQIITSKSGSPILKQPDAFLQMTIVPFLDGASLCLLSSSCNGFYQRIKKPLYWKDKLLSAGCAPEVLKEAIALNVVHDYGALYTTYTYFGMQFRRNAELWELLCLSGDPKAIDYLDKNKLVTAETKNSDGRSVLHLAATTGSISAIERALAIEHFALYNCKTAMNETPLHWAAWSGRVDVIDWPWWQRSIDPLAKTKRDTSLVHFAAQSGEIAMLERVLKIPRTDPDAKSKYNETLLYWAVSSSRVSMINYVLKMKGSDPTATTTNNATLFHTAVSNGSLRATQYIILSMKEIDFTARLSDGRTAVYLAAGSESLEVFEEVMSIQGMDPLAKTDAGETPLHSAACWGSPQMIERVAAVRGMDLLAKSTTGRTVFHSAAKAGLSKNIIMLRVLVYQQLGIDYSPTTQDQEGHDVYWHADTSWAPKAVKAALDIPIETLMIEARKQPKKVFKPLKKPKINYVGLASEKLTVLDEKEKAPDDEAEFNVSKPSPSTEQKEASLSKVTPDEIVPGLLLGSRTCDDLYLPMLLQGSKEPKKLAILRCTSAPVPVAINQQQVDQLPPSQFIILNIDNRPVDEKNSEPFDAGFHFIDQALSQDKKVVVYCDNGTSSAPAVVAAFLMRQHHLTAEGAINHITHVRPIVDVGTNLQSRLEDYGRKLAARAEEIPPTPSTVPQQLTQNISFLSSLLEKAVLLHPYYRSIAGTLCIIGGISVILVSVFVAMGTLGIGTAPAILGIAGGATLLCGGFGLFYYAHHREATAVPATVPAPAP